MSFLYPHHWTPVENEGKMERICYYCGINAVRVTADDLYCKVVGVRAKGVAADPVEEEAPKEAEKRAKADESGELRPCCKDNFQD